MCFSYTPANDHLLGMQQADDRSHRFDRDTRKQTDNLCATFAVSRVSK